MSKLLRLNHCRPLMHLTLCFGSDGTVDFYPEAEDPERLAIEFAKIINLLHENPERILCAAGACTGRGIE